MQIARKVIGFVAVKMTNPVYSFLEIRFQESRWTVWCSCMDVGSAKRKGGAFIRIVAREMLYDKGR